MEVGNAFGLIRSGGQGPRRRCLQSPVFALNRTRLDLIRSSENRIVSYWLTISLTKLP
jgi:hypothetical protein